MLYMDVDVGVVMWGGGSGTEESSSAAGGGLVKALVETFNPRTISFHNLSYVSDFRQLILQVVDRGQDGSRAGDLGVGVLDDIPGAIVGVLDGQLHLLLQLVGIRY